MPLVKSGLGEPCPELPAATSAELIHLEHTALFQCGKHHSREGRLNPWALRGPSCLCLDAETGKKPEDRPEHILGGLRIPLAHSRSLVEQDKGP